MSQSLRMLAKDKEGQPLTGEGISRWKLSTGHAFREHICSKILCIMVGNGVQIAGIAIVGILSSAHGLISTWSSKGLLWTGMIISYLLCAIVSGYMCVWLWRCINRNSEGWSSISWCNSCALSSIGFAIFTVLSIAQYLNDGTTEISLPVYFTLLILWIFISIPLSRLGGLIAARSNESVPFSIRISQNQREGPTRELWPWFLVLVAGLLPFGAIALELYIVLINIAFGTFHRAFVFVSILSLVVVISCAIVSVGLTYRCLLSEDWMWWWKAFCASSLAGPYMFILTVKYLIIDLRGSSGPISAVVYLGHSMILCVAIMLFTGTVGFLSAFAFLRILNFLKDLGYPISLLTKNPESEMQMRYV